MSTRWSMTMALLFPALAGAPLAAQQATPPKQPAVALPMQSPPPTALPTFARSAEIDAMIVRARALAKPGQPVLLQPIHQFGSYTTYLEYRRGPWPSAVHEDVELFYVVKGSGSFILGGTETGPGQGKGIEGGRRMKVHAGDFFFVPPGTVHQFPDVDGELVMISMHIPAPGEQKP